LGLNRAAPVASNGTPGDEPYWFGWDSSFDGKATIHIARLGGEAMVFGIYLPSRFGKVRRSRGL
jgi:hypothetical protein